ncbi:hypothetical protein niasHT_002384 [Heterodera trifolii]|uniref:Uncharacterized protein n=1 Tax=Heterodera trifolii TaxID=157864 RepID=A0ABD2LM47_9BILA
MPISSPFLTPLGHLFHRFVPPPPPRPISHRFSRSIASSLLAPSHHLQQIMHLMAKVSIPQQSVRDGNGHNGDTRLAAVKPLVYYSGLASPAHPLTSPPQAIPSFICISFSSFCSEVSQPASQCLSNPSPKFNSFPHLISSFLYFISPIDQIIPHFNRPQFSL